MSREEEYVNPHTLKHRIRLPHMPVIALMVPALLLLLGTLTACGKGNVAATDETAVSTGVLPSNSGKAEQSTIDNFIVTYDEFGLLNPNFFYSIYNDSLWSIQADVAENVWDPNFKTVIRIDIQKPAGGEMPSIAGKAFSMEDNGQHEKFPGSFLVFNGQQSTLRKVESGTISFSPDSTLSGEAAGAYDVVLTDYDSTLSPTPHYRLLGTFRFKAGTYNAALFDDR